MISSSSSGKEKKKESPSLEDQNAAAIQCIVDAKISSAKISEVTHNHQSENEGYTGVSSSAVDTQTVNTVSPINSSQERLSHSSSQLTENSSATVGSSQQETNQTAGSNDRSMIAGNVNPTEVANDRMHGEVILFEGNLTFLDNNASYSLSTESSSNSVSDPPPLTTQLSGPLVVTSQPSVYKAGTTQIMAITIPGNSDTLHSAVALSDIPLYPPPEQVAPHCLVTSNASQAVDTFAIPVSQNVNSVAQERDVLPMSTVIMCGNDGLIPQFISVPQKESGKYAAVLISDCQRVQ